jgi:two-component system C4-dicarboxylate transport sensor histidine kinase DctB
MTNRKNASKKTLIKSAGSAGERMLLRKLADNYYGASLARLINGIVHNLNSPLQVLYVRSEQLEQGLGRIRTALQSEDVKGAEKLATGMEEKLQSILTSLDDLNAQLRYLGGELVTQRCSEIGDVNLNQVVDECVFLLNADPFFKHGVEKTINTDDALPMIRGRKTDFCVVVLALVQNALEAMADTPDKHLTIETSRKGDKAIIKIRDTGCGISEQVREHMYEIYFTTKRIHADNDQRDKHLGLGLSLVSVLLEDYDAVMTCQSAIGETIFTIQIPGVTRSS